jgi:hypothetical protein
MAARRRARAALFCSALALVAESARAALASLSLSLALDDPASRP